MESNLTFRPTIVLIVAIVCICAIYDIWAVSHSYEWTISANLLLISRQWPAIPFIGGFLLGHVLFPNRAAGAEEPKTLRFSAINDGNH